MKCVFNGNSDRLSVSCDFSLLLISYLFLRLVDVNRLQRSQQPLFGYPNIVRFSWATTKELLKTRETEKSNGNGSGRNKENKSSIGTGASSAPPVPVQWLCDEDEELNGCQAISSFFNGGNDIHSFSLLLFN